MRSKLSIFLILGFSTLVHAAAGGINGGGGDPLVNDFLKKADLIEGSIGFDFIPAIQGSSLKKDSFKKTVDVTQFSEITKKIRASLDGQNPLLIFPAGSTVYCFGAPKVGCVSNEGVITVARDGYIALAPSRQFELVALEYFKLMNISDRYELAQSVEYYMRGKGEKADSSYKNDIDALIYQVDHLTSYADRLIKTIGHDKMVVGEKLGAVCFQVAQLYSGNLAYYYLALDFVRKTHPHESSFQFTDKELGIIGNLETTATQEIGLPYFCGSKASLTISTGGYVDSDIKKGHAEDLLKRVLIPTLNDLKNIKTNLQNY